MPEIKQACFVSLLSIALLCMSPLFADKVTRKNGKKITDRQVVGISNGHPVLMKGICLCSCGDIERKPNDAIIN